MDGKDRRKAGSRGKSGGVTVSLLDRKPWRPPVDVSQTGPRHGCANVRAALRQAWESIRWCRSDMAVVSVVARSSAMAVASSVSGLRPMEMASR